MSCLGILSGGTLAGLFDLGGGWVALPPVIGSVSLVSNKEGGTRGRGGEEVNHPLSPETHIL